MDIFWPVWVLLYAELGVLTLSVAGIRGALDDKTPGFFILLFLLWWVLWGVVIAGLLWALARVLWDVLMEIIKFLVWLVLGGNV